MYRIFFTNRMGEFFPFCIYFQTQILIKGSVNAFIMGLKIKDYNENSMVKRMRPRKSYTKKKNQRKIGTTRI